MDFLLWPPQCTVGSDHRHSDIQRIHHVINERQPFWAWGECISTTLTLQQAGSGLGRQWAQCIMVVACYLSSKRGYYVCLHDVLCVPVGWVDGVLTINKTLQGLGSPSSSLRPHEPIFFFGGGVTQFQNNCQVWKPSMLRNWPVESPRWIKFICGGLCGCEVTSQLQSLWNNCHTNWTVEQLDWMWLYKTCCSLTEQQVFPYIFPKNLRITLKTCIHIRSCRDQLWPGDWLLLLSGYFHRYVIFVLWHSSSREQQRGFRSCITGFI